MPQTFIQKIVSESMMGPFKTIGGVLAGAAQGISGEKIKGPGGAASKISNIAGLGVGYTIRAGTKVAKAAAKYGAKVAPKVGSFVADNVSGLGAPIAGIGKIGKGIFKGAFKSGGERTADNLFTGLSERGITKALVYGGFAAAALGGMGSSARNSVADFNITPYDERAGIAPDALSADGAISNPTSKMKLSDMGGTGDLVHALHANRHG